MSTLSTAVNSSENINKNAESYAETCAQKMVDMVPTPFSTPVVSMTDLIARIKTEMGPHGLDSKSVDINRIIKLMENYQSNSNDWSQYALFDPFKYTRNLVDDGNGQFNLIVICWGPGHVSPIHDHNNSHCCMKMLQGQLKETRYHFPSDPTSSPGKLVKDGDASTMYTNEVAYINDSLGLHRVSNLTSIPAISLHLYTPPIKICHTYEEHSGTARPASQCVFYSKNGVRTSTPAQCVSKPVIHTPPNLWIPLSSMEKYVAEAVSAVSSPCQADLRMTLS